MNQVSWAALFKLYVKQTQYPKCRTLKWTFFIPRFRLKWASYLSVNGRDCILNSDSQHLKPRFTFSILLSRIFDLIGVQIFGINILLPIISVKGEFQVQPIVIEILRSQERSLTRSPQESVSFNYKTSCAKVHSQPEDIFRKKTAESRKWNKKKKEVGCVSGSSTVV